MNNSVNSPFEYGLKYSSTYANYGVDKTCIERELRNTQNPNAQHEQDQYCGASSSASNMTLSDILNTDIDKTVIDTITEPKKNNRQKMNAAIIVGTSVTVLGGLTFALTKRKIPKVITDGMGKIIDNITKKTEEIKQKPTISNCEGLFLSGLQKVKKGAYMVRGAFFNYTPLKDALFEKVVAQKCGLKKPCDAITGFFRKVSFSTVKSSYKNAGNDISNMTNAFNDVNTRIASGEFTKTGTEYNKSALGTIHKKMDEIHSVFGTSFKEEALNKRNDNLTQSFSGLGNRVYNKVYGNLKEFVKNAKEWTTFISESLVEEDKTKFIKNIDEKKRIITNSPQDNFNKLNEIIVKLRDTIDPSHSESRNAVKKLNELSNKYLHLSGANEAAERSKINEEIKSVLADAISASKSETYTPEKSKRILSLVNQCEEIINTDKKGVIEEILTIYKSILPQDEYAKVKKSAQKAVKSLNKAAYTEGYEYVDKARDLAIGSALTDVAMGMALPVATTSVILSATDSKEKKRSVALKYGLPLLMGITTSTLCTVKLISGGRALIFGALAGAITNNLCEHIDDKLKKHDEFLKAQIKQDNINSANENIKNSVELTNA